MIELFQFAWSPFCLPQQRILEFSGAHFKLVNVLPQERSLVWKLTRQKYYGVPILPGSEGVLSCAEEAIETANRIGYPVILKASAGGGGRGMRVCNSAEELPALLSQAQQEAGAAFSSADVYLETELEEKVK